MKNGNEKENEMQEIAESPAEQYYKKIMRIVEYYVLICFILITFVPLLNFTWVPGFVKFIYVTGFPLLILLFVVSLFKEPLINLISKYIKK